MENKDNQNLVSLISDKVDKKRDNIVNFCRDLIKIPSVTGDETLFRCIAIVMNTIRYELNYVNSLCLHLQPELFENLSFWL